METSAYLVYQLDEFANRLGAFTADDLIQVTDTQISTQDLLSALQRDGRFLCLSGDCSGETYFISERALLRWFAFLNLRLAAAGIATLSEQQVANRMSMLRSAGRWDRSPRTALRWGQSLGLVRVSANRRRYIFPLAHMLSHATDSVRRSVATVIEEIYVQEQWKAPCHLLSQQSMEMGLLEFPRRIVHVVKEREGLGNGSRKTLEQIGRATGVTRERIRQLEARFWNTLPHVRRGGERLRQRFIQAWLYDFFACSGNAVEWLDSAAAARRMFLGKCLGIPQMVLPELGVVILGTSSADLRSVLKDDAFMICLDRRAIMRHLQNIEVLTQAGLRTLSLAVMDYWNRHLNKGQRAYLALRKIGSPAHFTKIAEVHNSMFPAYESTAENIHAALCREQWGVVWVGARGMFALEEWGYRRPKRGLFEAVEQIVREKYGLTGRPVSITVICAEIGKERAYANPSSIAFATSHTPALKRVGSDSYVPSEAGDESSELLSEDRLDAVLREFDET